MRVIFIRDVDRVGTAGEVKDVADGYGRNYLLPKGLAELATADGLKRADEYRQAEERRHQALNAEMKGVAGMLEGLEVSIKVKAGDKGRLYGSVTSADIAEEAQRLTGHDIDKRKVELHEPIHHLGEYDVTVKLSRDLAPVLKVVVIAEGAEGKAAAEDGEPVAKDQKKAKKKDTGAEPQAELQQEPEPDAAGAAGTVTIEPAADIAADTPAEPFESQIDQVAGDIPKE